MKDFLETTVGRVILGVIVLTVWGVNVVQFSDALKPEKTGPGAFQEAINLDALEPFTKETFTYRRAARSPFDSFTPPRPQPSSAPPPEFYQPPPIKVLGVMDGTIMVLDPNNNMIVVKQAETFNGITVKTITQDSVIFEHRKNTFVIKVNS